MCVHDLAYVFHMDTIQTGLYATSYGMANAYYLRLKMKSHVNERSDILASVFFHLLTLFAQFGHIPFTTEYFNF